MSLTVFASLIITYAVVQTVVFLLLIRFVDPYEREPVSLLAVMALWGAIGATSLSALGNTFLRNFLPGDVAIVFGRAIYAPVVEELAKGIALIIFVVISVRARGRFGMPRFEGVTDGIVYGAAVGLGFAFTEDILYLLVGASRLGLEQGFVDYLARRDFFGLGMLHHAIYTAAFGVGLGLATWSLRRGSKALFGMAGMFVAILLHSFNNGWVQLSLVSRFGFDKVLFYAQGGDDGSRAAMTEAARSAARAIDVADFLLVVIFVALIMFWLRYQRRVITTELEEETSTGLISRTELVLLPRYWQRTMWYWQLIKTGQWERWRLLRRIHNELVNLAFTKHRIARGTADSADADQQRRIIIRLKAQKAAFI